MQMFRVIGSWLRGLYLMGFGGFWMIVAYLLARPGDTSVNSTSMMTGSLGALTFVGGLIIVVRGVTMADRPKAAKKTKTGSPEWRADDDGDALVDFDPDAAIERYLKNRPEPAAAHAGGPRADPIPTAPVRPSFGRKQA